MGVEREDGGEDEQEEVGNGVSSEWILQVLAAERNGELGANVFNQLRGQNGKWIDEAEDAGCHQEEDRYLRSMDLCALRF